MRLSSAMIPAVLLAAGLFFFAGEAGPPSGARAGCEPGADLDLAARVMEVVHEGSRARVTLEVVFTSRKALRSYRIFASRSRNLSGQGLRVGTARHREEQRREVGRGDLSDGRSLFSSTSSPRLLRRGDSPGGADGEGLARVPTYTLRHTVTLDRGRAHGLVFTAEAEDPSGELRQAKAYVHVNLKPEEQPELLEDLVQFRARAVP